MRTFLCMAAFLVAVLPLHAQQADEAPFGAWYMVFASTRFDGTPLGLHGEVQYRNHAVAGDLQQLLIRTGLQAHLADGSATFTLGYGFVESEQEGTPDLGVTEHRLYQEALLRQQVWRVALNHRFRYEQRFVEDADFRTRYRYALFATLPLTTRTMQPGTVYAAGYNEVFLHGATGRDGGAVFDRNRLYGALGYRVSSALSVQAGYMSQQFTRGADGQLQLSAHLTL